jgi:hypothetical protein
VAPKGPPKFKPLVRTAVRVDSQVAPSKAALAEDFSKSVPLLFTGGPPEAQQKVAPLPKQQKQLGDIVTREDVREGPRPAAKPVQTTAAVRTQIIKTGKPAAPSIFSAEAAAAVAEPEAAAAAPEAEAAPAAEPEAAAPEAEAAPAAEPEAAAPEAEDAAAVVAAEQRPVVVAPPVKDAEEAFELKPELDELIAHVTEAATAPPNPSPVTPDYFVPENRRSFKYFLIQTYKKYILPPQSADPDPEACSKAAAASSKELKTFQYQAFVRDYLQRASPYRGLLVYHGLGSGKTCTSIATAEALYGAGNRKIFIMTPASLSGNYRGEMTKCGYFAFQQENFWSFVPASVKTPS